MPYSTASKILQILNSAPPDKRKRSPEPEYMSTFPRDSCIDPILGKMHAKKDTVNQKANVGIVRRQTSTLTPGYVTTDDFGTDGDDTPHSKIPNVSQPEMVQANASFPADKSTPQAVDLVFLDYIAPDVLGALKTAGASYTTADVSYYLPKTFTTNSYLPAYAKIAWQAGAPNCPVGG